MTAILLALLAGVPGAEAPTILACEVGDYHVEFCQQQAWTIYRILHKGRVVAGSNGFYGAVFVSKQLGGFVGTGHTEGGIEQVDRVSLEVDGKEVPLTTPLAKGSRAVLHKESRLHNVKLVADVTVLPDRIVERHVFAPQQEEPVGAFYSFMHAVVPATKSWVATTVEGKTERGEFRNDKALVWHPGFAWTASYDPAEQWAFVLRYRKAPTTLGPMQTGYWDQPHYHKLYCCPTLGGVLKPDADLDYEIAVSVVDAAPASWEAAAAAAADRLGRE